jgi:hypothetical protein
LKDVNLDKGAGELLVFPRRGRLAGAQTHEDVLPSRRLTRSQRDVLNDAVALVEDAEHGDALRHRSYASLVGRGGRGAVGRRPVTGLRLVGAIARGRGQREHERNGDPFHAYSGIHGS